MPDGVPQDWTPDYTPDPVPGAPSNGLADKLTPRTAGKITPALEKRLSGEIEMYVEFLSLPILLRDPTCGNAIRDQAEPVAKAVARILKRYPDLAHKLMATGQIGDWIALATALQPIGKTIWEHHIARPADDEGVQPHGFDPTDFPDYVPRPGE